jgi:drug/metabolite transporter (DMT)-like permease
MAVSAPRPSQGWAYAAWILICVVWGTTYLAIRIALETMPPMLMAGIRWVAAGAILLAFLMVRRRPIPGRQAWPGLALLGVLMTGFGNGGVVWAEQTISSGLAALLVAAIPFWMVSIDRLAPRPEPLRIARVTGLVVGFFGVFLLVWPELDHPRQGSLPGIAATQLACVGWSIGSIYSRRRQKDEDVMAAAALQMLFGGTVLLVVGGLLREWPALHVNTRTLSAIIYLVAAGSIAAYSAYLYALKHLPVSTVSLYAYVNPIIAVSLGTALLDEPFSPRIAVAGCVVLVGMLLVRRN